MPSAQGRGYSTVEVKPDGLPSRSNLAPASPGSPKAVRFAPSAKAASRQLTPPEAWSLFHFETHARRCPECYNPLETRDEGRGLCTTGHDLASDVAEHVFRQDGITYSRKKDNHKLVEVELPPGYTQVPQLLRLAERATRVRSQRTVPIIDYEPVRTTASRRTPDQDHDFPRGESHVIIEPARTGSRSQPRSRQKTTRYRTVVVDDDVGTPRRATATATTTTTPAPPVQRERRGSLYYEDMERRRRPAYEIEIREPERREWRRERARSSVWL